MSRVGVVVILAAVAGAAGSGQGLPTGTFVAAYGSFLPQSSPKPTGGWVFATPVGAVGGVWSITGTEVVIQSKRATTVAWTGVAVPMTTPWGSKVFALAAPGGATTGVNSGYSVTGGLLVEVPRPKKGVWWRWMVPGLAGPAVVKSSLGNSQTFIRVTWGVQAK